ncbi:probable rRNA-processing protein EBP2 homolog [Aristolochia californica]|uniref:probable rRNA-processing protein EBP2 homolog n=1 Tax=Aristolochia californica TaxID=171875 RepID=UPI0035D867E1
MGGFKGEDFRLNKRNPVDDHVEDMTDDESESESEDEEVMLTEPSKKHVFNKEGLLEKLEDIRWPEKLDWIHTLSVNIEQEQKVDVNDDLTRELAFYTQAVEGSRQAFEKLQSMGLPFLRPADYYAEMAKSDSHMVKVKGRLLEEKKRIEEAEERRKAREAKKIAKEVQAQKLKERAKQKKQEIESVKKWRKQRQQNGFKGGKEKEMGLDFEDGGVFEKTKKVRPGVRPGDRSGGKGRFVGKDKKRKDREYKDSKFGYGGRKGLKKQNSADTTKNSRDFKKGDLRENKRRKR